MNEANLLSYKTHIDTLTNCRVGITFESIVVIHRGIWNLRERAVCNASYSIAAAMSAVTTEPAGDIPAGITGGSGGFVDVP